MKFNLYFSNGSRVHDTKSADFKKEWQKKEIEVLRAHYGTKFKISDKSGRKNALSKNEEHRRE